MKKSWENFGKAAAVAAALHSTSPETLAADTYAPLPLEVDTLELPIEVDATIANAVSILAVQPQIDPATLRLELGKLPDTDSRSKLIRHLSLTAPGILVPQFYSWAANFDLWNNLDNPSETTSTIIRIGFWLADTGSDALLDSAYLHLLTKLPEGERQAYLKDMLMGAPGVYFRHFKQASEILPLAEAYVTFAIMNSKEVLDSYDAFKHDPFASAAVYMALQEANIITAHRFAAEHRDELGPALFEKIDTGPRLTTYTALLLQNEKPDVEKLAEDPSLSLTRHIDPQWLLEYVDATMPDEFEEHLTTALGRHILRDDDMFSFYEDNQFVAQQLTEAGHSFNGKHPVIVERFAVLVARHLYKTDTPVTEENVHAAARDIIAMREQWKHADVISGRKILIPAHNEHWDSGLDRFGTSSLQLRLEMKSGSKPLIFEVEDRSAGNTAYQAVKAAFLDHIQTSIESETVWLDAHGSTTEFYLGDYVNEAGEELDESAISISADEVAQALIERYRKQTAAGGPTNYIDIYMVLHACSMYNFIQAVDARLAAADVPAPLGMVSPAEYGQLGFSNPQEETSSNMASYLLKLDRPTTIEVFMEIENDKTIFPVEHFHPSNPSIFVPDPATGRLFQIGGRIDASVEEPIQYG